jgi:AcrR family transcriptional regulator
MPKRVDHQQRRRDLADAVWRVVAHKGLDGTSLQLVADQAGWSIGSLRHYFASKAELLVFALGQAGERIEERIGRLPTSGTALGRLRAVVAELLALDTARREEALVWLAFIARATGRPGSCPRGRGRVAPASRPAGCAHH